MLGRIADILVLVAVLLVSVWGGLHHAGLAVDYENRAMKAVGTEEAETAARRMELFGVDHDLIVLLEPRAASQGTGGEAEIRTWVDALRDDQDVETVRLLPAPRAPESRVVVLSVRGGAGGTWLAPVQRVLRRVRATAPPTYRVSISGLPPAEIAIAEALIAEQSRIVPVIVGVLVLMLLLAYRRIALAAAAVIPAGVGILVLAGVQGSLGIALDPASSLLAPVLLTVGVAGSIHLLEGWQRNMARGASSSDASRRAVRDLLRPASLAVLTTIAGFLGLQTSPVPAVQRFGLLAALGVCVTATAALVVTPILLRLFARGRVPASRHVPWRVMGPGSVAWLRGRRRPVLLAALLVLATGLLGVGGLHVDTDPLRVLPPSAPFRVETARIAAAVGGSETFELLLPADEGGSWFGVTALQARVLGLDGVVGVTGPVRTAESGERLLGFVLAPEGSSRRAATLDAAERLADEAGYAGARVTGNAVQVARDSNALVLGQLEGLGLTLLCLWAVMAIGFRSMALATLGLLPNVLPCLAVYGAMGALGRPLSVGSAMIGSVMLGLVVDDTIHFLHAYSGSRRLGRGRATSVARALRRAGRAITRTSAVLACGFLAGLLGSLETTREFGALAAATVVIAWFADVLLLPALLLLPRRGGLPVAGRSPRTVADADASSGCAAEPDADRHEPDGLRAIAAVPVEAGRT